MYHAKYGYNKVFGNDVDTRKSMTEPQLIERFDQVWERVLLAAVQKADICDAENARRKLKPDQQGFVDDEQEQREFWLEEGLFVAQLLPQDNQESELTQLWFVRSSNVDPRTLFITFETVAERERFREIASQLGWQDSDLGEKLLTDFMNTVSRRRKSH